MGIFLLLNILSSSFWLKPYLMLRLFNLLRQWREEKREQAARPPNHCGDGDEAGSADDDLDRL